MKLLIILMTLTAQVFAQFNQTNCTIKNVTVCDIIDNNVDPNCEPYDIKICEFLDNDKNLLEKLLDGDIPWYIVIVLFGGILLGATVVLIIKSTRPKSHIIDLDVDLNFGEEL